MGEQTNRHWLANGFRLDDISVFPARSEVRGPSGTEHVEPRVIELAIALAERAGEVVSRDELIDRVWGGAAGADQSLSTTLSRLRRALNDSPTESRFIQTVPKRGYRLIVAPEPLAALKTESDLLSPGRPQKARARRWLPTALGLLGIAAIIAFGVLSITGPDDPARHDAALERVFTPPPNSIAVLPFRSTGLADDERYLGEELAEEILNRLAEGAALQVVTRSSSFSLDTRTLEPDDIGQRLNAAYILKGDLRSEMGPLRLTLELVTAADGYRAWGNVVILDGDNLQRIDDEVAAAVKSVMLGAEFATTPTVSLPDPPANVFNMAAFEAYLTGRHNYRYQRRDPANPWKAFYNFSRAVALDPDFAAAWGSLGESYLVLGRQPPKELKSLDEIYDFVSTAVAPLSWQDRGVKAHEAIIRSLTLDPDSPEGLSALGVYYQFFQDNPQAAAAAYRQVIQINPSYAEVYARLKSVLMVTGPALEMFETARRAYKVDSAVPGALLVGAFAEATWGRPDQAEAMLRRLIALGNDDAGYAALTEFYYQQGRMPLAIEWGRKALEDGRRGWYAHLLLVLAHLHLGDLAAAEKDAGDRFDYLVALARGETDRALELISKDRDDGAWPLLFEPFRATIEFYAGANEKALARFEAIGTGKMKEGLRDQRLLTENFQAVGIAIAHYAHLRQLADPKRPNDELLDECEKWAKEYAQVNANNAQGLLLGGSCALGRGDQDAAMIAFEKAYEDGWRELWHIQTNPLFQPLRNRRDFQQLVARIEGDLARQLTQVAAAPDSGPSE